MQSYPVKSNGHYEEFIRARYTKHTARYMLRILEAMEKERGYKVNELEKLIKYRINNGAIANYLKARAREKRTIIRRSILPSTEPPAKTP